MRIQSDDDHEDIRTLIERGSSTWVGPSPSSRQARWTAEDRPRRWSSVGMAAAGFGAAAFLTGSLTLVATSQTPNGATATVIRLVSHVFTTPPPSAVTPTPSPPASAPPVVAGAPTPTGARPATARPARTPSPTPWGDEREGHHPSPSPSPSGTAGPTPSPSPSRSPDE